jgi:hypothetical protein
MADEHSRRRRAMRSVYRQRPRISEHPDGLWREAMIGAGIIAAIIALRWALWALGIA